MTTELIPYQELSRNALDFFQMRTLLPVQVWPRLGRDLHLIEEEEDGQPGSLLFVCHTDRSMSNPMGIVHGGITASLVDTCMGVTCAVQCGNHVTPTITMTVNYARPIPLDADIHVRTRIVRCGATSGQITSEVFLAGRPEEVLVTASGVYSIKRPRP